MTAGLIFGWTVTDQSRKLFPIKALACQNTHDTHLQYGCVSMFPSLYVPRSLCSSVLCSPVSMFPGPMFPGIYAPHYLCSPVSMFPRPMFPSIYVLRYLCSPVGLPMLPSIYVPRYLYSPYPTMKDHVMQSQ